MLSRVAESIYWLNRYVERAENYSRMLDENFNLSLELPPGMDEQWFPLVLTTGEQERYENLHGNDYGKENVLNYLTFNRDNPNSIYTCVLRARENARSVREILSSESWQHINNLYIFMKNSAIEQDGGVFRNHRDFFQEIKTASHLLLGLSDSTMSHGEGWQFAQLGRYLERADMTTRILDMKYYYLLPSTTHVGLAIDLLHWTSLLRSASASEMFRKSFGKPDPHRIVQFLTLNTDFPRSIHFCLMKAQDSIHAVSGSPTSTFVNKAEKLIGRLKADLDYTESTDIFFMGLHEYMDQMQTRINSIHSAINEVFFAIPEEGNEQPGNVQIQRQG